MILDIDKHVVSIPIKDYNQIINSDIEKEVYELVLTEILKEAKDSLNLSAISLKLKEKYRISFNAVVIKDDMRDERIIKIIELKRINQ
jgi:hypothetical protein